MNDTTVILCILNAEVSSEKDLKGEHLIIDWKVIMEGYDGFRINCSVNTIHDLTSTVTGQLLIKDNCLQNIYGLEKGQARLLTLSFGINSNRAIVRHSSEMRQVPSVTVGEHPDRGTRP